MTNAFNFGPELDEIAAEVKNVLLPQMAGLVQAAALLQQTVNTMANLTAANGAKVDSLKVSVQQQLSQIQLQITALEKEMAEDFTSLNQAVSDLQSEVGSVAGELDQLFQDLQNGMQANNQPAIDAATAAIQAQIQALKDAASRDMPPAPPSGP